MKHRHLDVLRVTEGHERQLRRALKALIARAANLISAIGGTTDQFEKQASVLSNAASDAEIVLNNSRGQS